MQPQWSSRASALAYAGMFMAGASLWLAFSKAVPLAGLEDGTFGAASGVAALLLLYVPAREVLRAGLVGERVRLLVRGARTGVALWSAIAFACGEMSALVLTHAHPWVWGVRSLLEGTTHIIASLWLLRSGATRGRLGGLPRLARDALLIALVRLPLSYLVLCRGLAVSAAALPALVVAAASVWFSLQYDAPDGGLNSLGNSLRGRMMTLPEMRREVAAQRSAVRPLWALAGVPLYTGALVLGITSAGLSAGAAGYNFATVDEANLRSVGPAMWLLVVTLGFYAVAGFLHAVTARTKVVLECALGCAGSFLFVWLLVGISGFAALAACITLSPLGIALAALGAWAGVRFTAKLAALPV